jgi:uncharacterized RDD family membrane protein YckC
MRPSAARAGLWPRFIAVMADLFIVSVIMSLCGILLAGATGGRVRAREVIGSQIHCTVGQAASVELNLPTGARVEHVSRCVRAFLGVPYDWSLLASGRTASSDGGSAAWGIMVPLDPTGQATSVFYIDDLAVLAFGFYAFLLEWQFGATLGKRLRGIRVRSLAGGPIDFRQAAKRTLMRSAAFAPAMVVSAFAVGSETLAGWLFEDPAWKFLSGGIVALWSIAFLINYIVATSRRVLPWHDRWAGTEAVLKRYDQVLRGVNDLPGRSPVPSWLIQGREKR